MTPAVGHLVREGKTHQIYSTLQSGAEHGMHTMDQSLAELVQQKQVSYDHAREKASDLKTFETLVVRPAMDRETAANAMATAGMHFDDDFDSGGLPTRTKI